MIFAFTLFIGVALVTGLAPYVLDRMLNWRFDPHVVIVIWAALVSTPALTTITALIVLLVPADQSPPLLSQLIHHCWTVFQDTAAIHEFTALVLTAGLVALCLSAGIRLLLHTKAQRRVHRRQLELLRIAARPEFGRFPIMWLPHPELAAYSIAGNPSLIVVTDGLRRELGAKHTAAVIEHERAHLLGHHHLVVRLAEALARSAPWLPLMRHSPALVRATVELAADRTAARLHGTHSVRSALRTMTSDRGDLANSQSALAMADNTVALRLHHLDRMVTDSSRADRSLVSGVAGLTAAAFPELVAIAASVSCMLFCTVLFCPFVLGS